MYLVEVFTCRPHLLPGLVKQLDADAEEFRKIAIVGEEHGMKVVTVFTGCGQWKQTVSVSFQRLNLMYCRRAHTNTHTGKSNGLLV